MELDPQSQAVLNGLNAAGVLPFRQFTPEAVRQRVLDLRASKPAPAPDDTLVVAEHMIPTGGSSFDVRATRPRIAADILPAVIYFHGGGFLFGSVEESDELARTIAKRAHVCVFNVDYHLAPEAKFPIAVDEAYAALCWVVANAAQLAIDPDNIILVGDSAGGNLAIVTCLMTREKGGPAVRFQIPIYPSLDLHQAPGYPSRLKWGGGQYVLDNGDIEWMLDHYLNKPKEGDDWRASPMMATDYIGLPAALVITADHDPLCDEGRNYAEKLQADGVAVEHACFEGTFHGFVGYASVLDVGARALDLICNRISEVGRGNSLEKPLTR